jgi:hypothetical protein
MCRAAKCRKCGKTTWAGCGAHVDQVMAGVPQDQRCRCHEKGASSADSTSSAATPAGSQSGGFFSSLFGKR